MLPSYLNLPEGELESRAAESREELTSCRLCPRTCKVNRNDGEKGYCAVSKRARVASYGPHPGEERPLRGTRGSGTIFFAGCNLGCVYCQNYDISSGDGGREVNREELKNMMLRLQEQGCPNVNLVSPSHVVPQILQSLSRAAAEGLSLPLVYNTGGYDSLETLKLLDGIVDIYMPDMKYQDTDVAERLSAASDYPEVNRAALKEMHRQVGNLKTDNNGVAEQGLLVRHLVLPGQLAGTIEAMNFLAENISTDTYINIMAQYYPAHKAAEHPPLNRRVTRKEIHQAVKAAHEAGLHRIDGFGRHYLQQ